MSDVRVVCRPEVATGFRLTGIPVVEATDAGAARAALIGLAAEGEAGVVLLQDVLADDVPPGSSPLVVLFPGPGWHVEAPEERMIELLRRAVGYRVRL